MKFWATKLPDVCSPPLTATYTIGRPPSVLSDDKTSQRPHATARVCPSYLFFYSTTLKKVVAGSIPSQYRRRMRVSLSREGTIDTDRLPCRCASHLLRLKQLSLTRCKVLDSHPFCLHTSIQDLACTAKITRLVVRRLITRRTSYVDPNPHDSRLRVHAPPLEPQTILPLPFRKALFPPFPDPNTVLPSGTTLSYR